MVAFVGGMEKPARRRRGCGRFQKKSFKTNGVSAGGRNESRMSGKDSVEQKRKGRALNRAGEEHREKSKTKKSGIAWWERKENTLTKATSTA